MELSDQERLIAALYTTGIQSLEDAIFSLIPRWDINKQEGKVLDDIGAVVGINREGVDDATYRYHLKGRIFVNSSSGRIDDVYRVWSAFVSTGHMEVLETYPAGIDIATDTSPDPEYIPLVYDYLDRALLAGVRLGNIVLYDPTVAFTFSPTNLPVTDSAKGFGDTNDPLTGGKLAGIII